MHSQCELGLLAGALLRLGARYICGEDALTRYTASPSSHPKDMETGALRLQE